MPVLCIRFKYGQFSYMCRDMYVYHILYLFGNIAVANVDMRFPNSIKRYQVYLLQ